MRTLVCASKSRPSPVDSVPMQQSTHLALSAALCGVPLSIEEGCAVVELSTSAEMQADAHGLVHGGFVFGLADYAAMLAINEPNVVLGSAEVKLLAPVAVGERLRATASLARVDGKKHHVDVRVVRDEVDVFVGTFVCFVPKAHVLEGRVGGRA